MGIPTLEIPQALTDSRSGEIAPLQDLARSIGAALSTYPHYVVVNGYPAIEDRTNLINLSKAIGAIGAKQPISGFGRPSKEKISFTKVQINSAKAKAGGEVTQYSRTHLALPPHTDSSYMPRPHELVAFQCIVSDQAGGESILIPVADLLPRLYREVVTLLRAPVYPFGNHLYPILAGETGNEQIRYYRAQIDRILEAGASPLSDKHRAAIETLDAVLQPTGQFSQFHLQAGQIVFMHNHRVLHGRTGFSPESDRLLYRVRLHVASFATADPAQTSALTPDPITAETSSQGERLSPDLSQGGDQLLIFKLNQDGGPDTIRRQVDDPDNQSLEQAKAHLLLAEKLKRLRRFDDALKHYRHASQLVPNNVSILNPYGKL